jgi:hypothetical protein
VERNRKAGQNPSRVVAPSEEEEEEDGKVHSFNDFTIVLQACT